MVSSQKVFLLSIVALKTLGMVIENTFTTTDFTHVNLIKMQYEVNINKYDLDLSGITTLTFEVKACQDATIVMSNSDDGNSSMPMYQFIFCGWENEKSAIRKQDQGVEVNTLGVCKCDEYRSFWISGDLRIGKGLNVGINVIAEWTDPDPFTIRSIGIYTWGGTGEWKVQLEVVDNLYDGRFSRCTTNYKAVLNILISKKNTSLLKCAALCDTLLSCIGLNYHNQSCELVELSPGVVRNIPKTQEDGWEFHSKCYRYQGACLWYYF